MVSLDGVTDEAWANAPEGTTTRSSSPPLPASSRSISFNRVNVVVKEPARRHQPMIVRHVRVSADASPIRIWRTDHRDSGSAILAEVDQRDR